MTGRTPRSTIRRLRTLGRTSFALGASLLLVAALAPLAAAQGNSPTAECGDGFIVKFDWAGTGWAVEGDTSSGISINVTAYDEEGDPMAFTWLQQAEATPVVETIVVFGGGSAATYDSTDTQPLTAPYNDRTKKEDDTHAISHITFCAGETPTPNETPTPSEAPTPKQTPTEEPTQPETPTEEPTQPETPTEEPTQLETPTEEPTVRGVVIERPPAPAAPADPPVGEPEPAPEVEVLGVTEELPRTGPADLWLAGFALILLGAGLLTVAHGKAMDATAPAAGTSWTNRTV